MDKSCRLCWRNPTQEADLIGNVEDDYVPTCRISQAESGLGQMQQTHSLSDVTGPAFAYNS
jgi:hypothetical protein